MKQPKTMTTRQLGNQRAPEAEFASPASGPTYPTPFSLWHSEDSLPREKERDRVRGGKVKRKGQNSLREISFKNCRVCDDVCVKLCTSALSKKSESRAHSSTHATVAMTVLCKYLLNQHNPKFSRSSLLLGRALPCLFIFWATWGFYYT